VPARPTGAPPARPAPRRPGSPRRRRRRAGSADASASTGTPLPRRFPRRHRGSASDARRPRRRRCRPHRSSRPLDVHDPGFRPPAAAAPLRARGRSAPPPPSPSSWRWLRAGQPGARPEDGLDDTTAEGRDARAFAAEERRDETRARRALDLRPLTPVPRRPTRPRCPGGCRRPGRADTPLARRRARVPLAPSRPAPTGAILRPSRRSPRRCAPGELESAARVPRGQRDLEAATPTLDGEASAAGGLPPGASPGAPRRPVGRPHGAAAGVGAQRRHALVALGLGRALPARRQPARALGYLDRALRADVQGMRTHSEMLVLAAEAAARCGKLDLVDPMMGPRPYRSRPVAAGPGRAGAPRPLGRRAAGGRDWLEPPDGSLRRRPSRCSRSVSWRTSWYSLGAPRRRRSIGWTRPWERGKASMR